MHIAVRSNNEELMKSILKRMNKPTFYDLRQWINGDTPEQTISLLIQELLNVGADINEIRHMYTPLIRAVMGGPALLLTQLLVRYGADINLGGDGSHGFRHSPLHMSISTCRYNHAAFFAKNGARFDVNSENEIPLMGAVMFSHPDIIELVLELVKESGREINLDSFVRLTMECDDREECALVFAQAGYMCSRDADFLNEIFHSAAAAGYIKFMDLLIEIRPQLVQCAWLRNMDLPDKLLIHADYVAKLLELSSQPLDLQTQCKFVIRSQLGPNFKTNVRSLPLPTKLKDYLSECVCQSEQTTLT